MNIVDRCRAWHKSGEAITGDVQLYLDAANEIERLRAENEELFEANGKLAYLNADNEQLRAALEWLRSYVSGHTVYGLPHALEKIDAALNEEPHAEIDRLRAELDDASSIMDALVKKNHKLRAALEFYADPETYHAIGGEFMGDFSDDHGHEHYVCLNEETPRYDIPRPMPGKRARAALNEETK